MTTTTEPRAHSGSTTHLEARTAVSGRKTSTEPSVPKTALRWTPDEDALLRELAPTHTGEQIAAAVAERFGRQIAGGGIRRRLLVLGAGLAAARPRGQRVQQNAWPPAAHALLTELAGTNLSAATIAERISVVLGHAITAQTVRSVASRRGLSLRTGEVRQKARKKARCACGDCQRCKKSSAMREQWASGQRQHRVSPHRAWTPTEDDRLRALAGHERVEDIATTLCAEFGTVRTPGAVQFRAWSLGVSTELRVLSTNRIGEIMGVWGPTAVAAWVKLGWLRCRQDRWRAAVMIFDEGALRDFITQYPWAYDWRMIEPGPWRLLAEATARRDPWLSVKDVSKAIGVRPAQVQKWLRRGVCPNVRREGPARFARLRIPLRDIWALRAYRDGAAERHRASFAHLQAVLRQRRAS